MTLLEVLVACGILVVGLASIAALLPAAGSLLAEASSVDRATALAANTAADLQFDKTLKPSDFSPFSPGVKAVMIGAMFPEDPFNKSPFKKLPSVPRDATDDEAYGAASCGVTVAPLTPGAVATSGMAVRMSVVVFTKQDTEAKKLTLSPVSPGIYKLTDGTVVERQADRKRYLPGCSWALAAGGGTARWLHVGSSWATFLPGGQQAADCFVAFTDADSATAAETNGSLVVHAFSGVARVEERVVNLD